MIELQKKPEAFILIKDLEQDFGAYHTWAYNALLFSDKPLTKRKGAPLSEHHYSAITDMFFSMTGSGKALYDGCLGHIPAIAFKTVSWNQTPPPSTLNDTQPIVDLRVDLTFSKEDILAHIELMINAFKRLHNIKPDNALRKRFDMYETYLNAWDLKTKGLSQLQLTKAFFPNTYQDDYENARHKVNGYIRQATRLINGGYKNIK